MPDVAHDWPSTRARGTHLPDRSRQWSPRAWGPAYPVPPWNSSLSHRAGEEPRPPHSIIPTGFKCLGIREGSQTCCHHLGKVATTWVLMKVLFVLHGHNFLRELLTTKSIPSKGHHMSCICFPSDTPTFMPHLWDVRFSGAAKRCFHGRCPARELPSRRHHCSGRQRECAGFSWEEPQWPGQTWASAGNTTANHWSPPRTQCTVPSLLFLDSFLWSNKHTGIELLTEERVGGEASCSPAHTRDKGREHCSWELASPVWLQ